MDEDPYRFAVIGDEDPEFMGGSYVFVQKYIHDMVAWNALPVEEQEKVIGRRKFNDVELSDEEKPKNAHNAVTNIGDDLKIVRANMPFAHTSKGEYGTYYRLCQHVQHHPTNAGEYVRRCSRRQYGSSAGLQHADNGNSFLRSVV